MRRAFVTSLHIALFETCALSALKEHWPEAKLRDKRSKMSNKEVEEKEIRDSRKEKRRDHYDPALTHTKFSHCLACRACNSVPCLVLQIWASTHLPLTSATLFLSRLKLEIHPLWTLSFSLRNVHPLLASWRNQPAPSRR